MFFFNRQNINDAVTECKNTPGAVLIDVRETYEYKEGHIPSARNIPLSRIDTIRLGKDKPLYVYCLSGSRSRQAVNALKKMGYTNVKNIGGISSYKGSLE